MSTTIQDKIKVMQAFAEGAKIEWSPKGRESELWIMTASPVWDWRENTYRIAPAPETPAPFVWPEGYEVHNPADVLSAGKGWRFLSTLEVGLRREGHRWCNAVVHAWDALENVWEDTAKWGGSNTSFTYRVPVSHPFPPLPEPPVYVPWTWETRPSGSVWVKPKSHSAKSEDEVTSWREHEAVVSGYGRIPYKGLFDLYTLLDGSPCGTLQTPAE